MTLEGLIKGQSPLSKPNSGSPMSRCLGSKGLHRGRATTTIWPLARVLNAAAKAKLDERPEPRRHSMKRAETLAVASGFFAVLIFPGLAPAQSGQGLGVVSTIAGQATISRTSLSQPIPLQFKDSVFDRDRIATAENSTVRVLMGGKALVTVRELSVLTITEELNRSTVDLQSGKIALGVLQQKMRPGEAIEVRTHNAVAAVRGTVIVVEIVRASAQLPGGPPPALTTNVHVIHGSAVVTPTNIAGASPITVAQFQTYSQIGNILGTIRPLTPTAVNQLMANLRSRPQFGQGSGSGGAT